MTNLIIQLASYPLCTHDLNVAKLAAWLNVAHTQVLGGGGVKIEQLFKDTQQRRPQSCI
jgi:hypothetical protein